MTPQTKYAGRRRHLLVRFDPTSSIAAIPELEVMPRDLPSLNTLIGSHVAPHMRKHRRWQLETDEQGGRIYVNGGRRCLAFSFVWLEGQ